MDEPLIALIISREECPVVELYSELSVEVSLNILLQEDIQNSWLPALSKHTPVLLALQEENNDATLANDQSRIKELEFALEKTSGKSRMDQGTGGPTPHCRLSEDGEEDYLEVVKKFFSCNEDRICHLTVSFDQILNFCS